MTKETMTVHQALAELKTIDARIMKSISDGKFVTANKHSNEKISGVTIENFKERMKSDYQRVTDLIKRRNAIKRAVVNSNSCTVVEVDGERYTVAEAIDMKNHGMEYVELFIAELLAQSKKAEEKIEKASGDAIEEKAEKYVLAAIAAQPRESKMSIDSSAMQELRKCYIENNKVDLIDPNNVKVKIEELQEMINRFSTKIDAALSVSNALSTIKIEY